jgi:glycosyltransferase involved in cell wall biosynthesis
MTRPLLSICIATYNRAQYIGQTLESIIPQLTAEVEIVVVDGASTDGTGDIVRKYAETCRQLKYIRLSAKGGVDQDYCVAVEQAEGEMCWLFPDDDLLKPGAVSAVLEKSEWNYSLIIVNAQVMNKDFSETLEDTKMQMSTDEEFEGSRLDLLFLRVVPYMSFIGCVVVRRELWLNRERARYFGTEFIHMGVIFQAPLPSPALVMAEPYIKIRYGNAQWTSRSLEIWMFKWPGLINSFELIPELLRRKYQISNLLKKTLYVIRFRAIGAYSLKDYRKWFSTKDASLPWRTVAFSAAIMPEYVANIFIWFYYKFFSKQALIIFDLENSKYSILPLIKKYFLRKQRENVCI